MTTIKYSVQITELGTPRQRKGFVIWSDIKSPIRCTTWAEVQTILKQHFC